MSIDLIKLAEGGLVRWNEADSDPLADIEEWKRLVTQEQVVRIEDGADFAEIEKRILAAMLMDGECYIDFEAPGGYIDGGSFAKQRICDIVREPEPPGEPMKQNGRSAAYLKHDRTKQQGRKRR